MRAWFKALLGEGILWVEGISVISKQGENKPVTLCTGKIAHEQQRKILAPALRYGYSPCLPTFSGSLSVSNLFAILPRYFSRHQQKLYLNGYPYSITMIQIRLKSRLQTGLDASRKFGFVSLLHSTFDISHQA